MLEEMVRRTRELVQARVAARPLGSFAAALPRSDRSLEQSLRRQGARFILECKRASPSCGLIRSDWDPAGLARTYAPFADAISVLTNEPFFQGSLQDLAAVRAAVDLPVLCKDFVVDPYQVYEARAHGADAVLLMLSVLDDPGYRSCAQAAAALSMDVLAEVHSAAELERALALGARVVGINSRDLRTLAVDHAVLRELAPRVPRDRVLVAESGVRGHQDVLELAPLCDAFLVGSALCAAADVDAAVRSLVFGRVKVCGLTRPEDVLLVYRAGATYGGLIFAQASPRRVETDLAARLRTVAPLRWVGVFVDEAPAAVAARAAELSLAAVQLHGDEDMAYARRLRAELPEGCEVWKAVRVRSAVPRREETGADRLLVDAYHPGLRGGTGSRFDWDLVRDHPQRGELIVAGGLGPDNAAEAAALGVFALDVGSGLEADTPGRKSEARVEAFFAALRGTGRRGAT